MITLKIDNQDYLGELLYTIYHHMLREGTVINDKASIFHMMSLLDIDKCIEEGIPVIKKFIFNKYQIICDLSNSRLIINYDRTTTTYSVSVEESGVGRRHVIRFSAPTDGDGKLYPGGCYPQLLEFKHMNSDTAAALIAHGISRIVAGIECDIMNGLKDREITMEEIITENDFPEENITIHEVPKKKRHYKQPEKEAIISFEDIVKVVTKKGNNKREYNRTCDCWVVRGYFRHYRNGKTIFVNGFQKGKNRNKKEVNKTYNLEV